MDFRQLGKRYLAVTSSHGEMQPRTRLQAPPRLAMASWFHMLLVNIRLAHMHEIRPLSLRVIVRYFRMRLLGALKTPREIDEIR